MARPTTIHDETILEAARATFLERGVQATTAEVAARAGVSEGSIFNRFKTKADLFRAAMAPGLADPPWFSLLTEPPGARTVEERLFEVAMHLVVHFERVTPLMMMAWSNRGADVRTPLFSGEESSPPVRMLRRIGGFFDAEMRAGRIQKSDPEILARTFVGAIQSFVFLDLAIVSASLPLPAETFARGMIHVLCSGIAPKKGRKAGA